MIRKILTYIESNRLLTFEQPVIVGFSGGGDSVSLLYILNSLGYKCIAAHCNFHLREEESDRDENFCRKFTEEYHIIFEKNSFDAKSYATEKRISIEMAARDLRYRWFELIRKKYNAQAIAVAHHRDDSNETMLLNMIRGSGIRGLSGIRPKNGYIIRPLLSVDRKDLAEYLKSQHLSYITDSSNLSDEYIRNFIRLRLLPLMEKINPSVGTALARTAEHLADAERIYAQAIENAKKSFMKKTDDHEFCISINDIIRQQAPKTILYELLWPYGFTRQLSERVFHALTGESGKIFNAPDSDFKLLKDRDYLIIYKQSDKAPELYKIEENNNNYDDLPINMSIHKVKVDNSFEINRSPYTATFDCDKIKFPLSLRKWKSGDWFIPFGMEGRKKLSDYFSDHKFSIPKKNKTWLLCCGEDIIWIVGERTDNRFRINNNTKYALIINFFPEKLQ